MCRKSKEESYPIIKDARIPATYSLEGKKKLYCGRLFKFPYTYHKIVKDGRIVESEERDEEGDPKLRLAYQGYVYDLDRVIRATEEGPGDLTRTFDYYVVSMLSGKLPDDVRLSRSCYEPFGFTGIKLEKYSPVLEINKTDDNKYKICGSRYLARKGCVLNELGEVNEGEEKEKARNGQMLYRALYGHYDTQFYVIRNPFGIIKKDVSLISFIIVLFASLLKFCGKMLTCLPMKLGEWLLSYQNIIAKVLGHVFFTPFMPVKFLCNFVSTISKIPVLLFCGDRKVYGDFYWKLWKFEFIECMKELWGDLEIISKGKRSEDGGSFIHGEVRGTWDELEKARQQFDMELKPAKEDDDEIV